MKKKVIHFFVFVLLSSSMLLSAAEQQKIRQRDYEEHYNKRLGLNFPDVKCRVFKENGIYQFYYHINKDGFSDIEMSELMSSLFAWLPVEKLYIEQYYKGRESEWNGSKLHLILKDSVDLGWMYISDCEKINDIEDPIEKQKFFRRVFHSPFINVPESKGTPVSSP